MARDLFHQAVKAALLKEQWLITADPLKIKIDGVKLEIDLAADKVVALWQRRNLGGRSRSKSRVF
jgi:XisH protein